VQENLWYPSRFEAARPGKRKNVMAVTSSRRAMWQVRFKASGHPPLPPDGRSRKFAKEGHTGPAPAGFYFAPRGVGQMGLELIGAFTMIGVVVAMLVLIFHFLVP
jgi:hypothetical protein